MIKKLRGSENQRQGFADGTFKMRRITSKDIVNLYEPVNLFRQRRPAKRPGHETLNHFPDVRRFIRLPQRGLKQNPGVMLRRPNINNRRFKFNPLKGHLRPIVFKPFFRMVFQPAIVVEIQWAHA